MTLNAETVTAVDQYFARHGRQRHRLARLHRATVEFLVAQHGVEALDRVELGMPCECCDEEQARAARLSWMKSTYRQRRNSRRRA